MAFSNTFRDGTRWMGNREDIVWARIVDAGNGVLSKDFVSAFCEPLGQLAPQYRSLAESVYRECSQFVHGNIATHSLYGSEIGFAESYFTDWCDKSDTMRDCFIFCYFSRYSNLLLPREVESIDEIISDTLGHVQEVRDILAEKRARND